MAIRQRVLGTVFGLGLLMLAGFDRGRAENRPVQSTAAAAEAAEGHELVVLSQKDVIATWRSLELNMGSETAVVVLYITLPGGDAVPSRPCRGQMVGAYHTGPKARYHHVYRGGAVSPPPPPEEAHLYHHEKLIGGRVSITPAGPIVDRHRGAYQTRRAILRFSDLQFDDGTVVRIAGPITVEFGFPPPP